jgi:uncharacterized repeat protein (TIGR03809 family)
MPAKDETRIDRITQQWRDLAERRLQYYTELYQSGRWRRYYTEERFVEVMAEVADTVSTWRKLADRPPQAFGEDKNNDKDKPKEKDKEKWRSKA